MLVRSWCARRRSLLKIAGSFSLEARQWHLLAWTLRDTSAFVRASMLAKFKTTCVTYHVRTEFLCALALTADEPPRNSKVCVARAVDTADMVLLASRGERAAFFLPCLCWLPSAARVVGDRHHVSATCVRLAPPLPQALQSATSQLKSLITRARKSYEDTRAAMDDEDDGAASAVQLELVQVESCVAHFVHLLSHHPALSSPEAAKAAAEVAGGGGTGGDAAPTAVALKDLVRAAADSPLAVWDATVGRQGLLRGMTAQIEFLLKALFEGHLNLQNAELINAILRTIHEVRGRATNTGLFVRGCSCVCIVVAPVMPCRIRNSVVPSCVRVCERVTPLVMARSCMRCVVVVVIIISIVVVAVDRHHIHSRRPRTRRTRTTETST